VCVRVIIDVIAIARVHGRAATAVQSDQESDRIVLSGAVVRACVLVRAIACVRRALQARE
jgi:hypothetical protein